MGKMAVMMVNIIAVMLVNICGSDDKRGDSNNDCWSWLRGFPVWFFWLWGNGDDENDNVFVIIDIIQVAQKQKELQARFKELEKQEQVWTISIHYVWNIGWKM